MTDVNHQDILDAICKALDLSEADVEAIAQTPFQPGTLAVLILAVLELAKGQGREQRSLKT